MRGLNKILLLRQIRESGVEISSINELMKINIKHRALVKILIRHLSEIDDESDKEFIVRCLGVKGFAEATESLINEFYNSNNITFKWTIGNTLSIIENNEYLPKMLRIVQEKEHGIARQMIVEGLGRFKDNNVKAVLIELLNDEEVVGHAISALAKTGDVTVVKYIEPYLNHKVKWIRNEACKAIKKLSK